MDPEKAAGHGRASLAGLISGAHMIVFSPAADELRAFLHDALGLPSVDAGDGWPIFAVPGAELAVHPADAPGEVIYLLCEDLDVTLAELERRGFSSHTPIHQESWGRVTELVLPGGTELPLYEPRHPRPGA
ncbi:MAG: VOC family protein [Candidatus Limnocylindrales bacterium]